MTAAQDSREERRPAVGQADPFDQALREMLADPGNPDKTMRFATIATERKDFEGAISALSRLLITNPELWQVRYELGVLYFRLGSYGLAKSYFRGAEAGKDVPAETRQRIAEFIAQIDARTSVHRWSGRLTAGGRYQSNVNAASGAQLNLGGLQDQFARKADWDAFGSLEVGYIYDFDTVDGTVLETRFQAYGAKQMSEDEFDLVYVELDSGPRFIVLPGVVKGLSVRPFGQLDYARLADSELYFAKGGGLQLRQDFGDTIYAALGYRLRDIMFRNTAARPRLTDLDGVEHEASLELAFSLTDDLALQFRERLIAQNAHEPFESNLAIASFVGVSVLYDAPFAVTSERWSSSASVEYVRARYEAPDPAVAPGTTRVDDRWYFRVSTGIPLTTTLSLLGSLGYTENGSNLAPFEYDNFDATIAISYKF